MSKLYQLSILDEILQVFYFEGDDFKYDICFQKCQAHMSKKISNEI